MYFGADSLIRQLSLFDLIFDGDRKRTNSKPDAIDGCLYFLLAGEIITINSQYLFYGLFGLYMFEILHQFWFVSLWTIFIRFL